MTGSSVVSSSNKYSPAGRVSPKLPRVGTDAAAVTGDGSIVSVVSSNGDLPTDNGDTTEDDESKWNTLCDMIYGLNYG
jgi:hypothetical protein